MECHLNGIYGIMAWYDLNKDMEAWRQWRIKSACWVMDNGGIFLLKRNLGLDIVRSAAIFMVLISHCRHIFHADSQILGQGLWRLSIGGFYGVELFFVLSGFLIGRILIRNIADSRKESLTMRLKMLRIFWVRRWFRTLPLYYLILGANVALHQYAGGIFGYFMGWQHLVFLQCYDGDALNFFPESWSLCVEEWFYLLAPLLLIFLALARLKIWPSLVTVIVGIMVLRTAYVMYAGGDLLAWDNYIRKNIFLRLDSLGIGVAFAYIYLYRRRLFNILSGKKSLLAGGAGLMTILLLYELYEGFLETFFAKSIMFDVVSICWGLVLCFCFHIRMQNTWAVWFFTTVSKISYSVYLVHLPVFVVAASYTAQLPNIWMRGLVCLGSYGVVMMLAYVLYRYYEQPAMQLRDRFSGR